VHDEVGAPVGVEIGREGQQGAGDASALFFLG
jgi:hypothetical protein